MADKSFWGDKKDKVWLQNFWYYYKKVVIWGLIVLVCVVYGLVECARKVDYDMMAYYLGSGGLPEGTLANASAAFTELVDDADGKDGVNVRIMDLGFPPNSQDIEKQKTMASRIQAELISGKGYLYIMNRDLYVYCKGYEMLEDISEYTGDDEPVYAIDIKNNEYFKDFGFVTGEELYLGLRKIDTKREGKEIYKIKHNNAEKVIEYVCGLEK